MGKFIVGTAIGIRLATGGLTLTQYRKSTDSQGNRISGYTDQYGNSMYQDSQGRTGYLYGVPPAAAVQPRNPC